MASIFPLQKYSAKNRRISSQITNDDICLLVIYLMLAGYQPIPRPHRAALTPQVTKNFY